MTYRFTTILLILLPFISKASEINFDLRYFSYENDLSAKKTSFFAGEFLANQFNSNTGPIRLNLNEKKTLLGRISVDHNDLNIHTDIFDFDFDINEIPFYSEINFINLIDLNYSQSDYITSFKLSRIHFRLFDYEVFYKNLKGQCENLAGQEFSFVSACLNNSKFETINTETETALGQVRSEDFSLDFSVQELELLERQILFSTNNLDLKYGTFIFQAEFLSLRCSKKIYNDTINGLGMTKDCLNSGDISMPVMKFSEVDLELEGELSVKSFLSNPTKMTFVSDALNINFGSAKIDAQMILAECKTPALGVDFTYMDVPYSCFEQSFFKLGGFSYIDENVETTFNETNLKIDKDKISLTSPEIIINLPSEQLKVVINNADIICDKLFEKSISAQSILEGCFNSSKLNISNINIIHPIIDTEIKIESIEVDKNSIHLQSSVGGYKFNDLKNTYKDLDFRCGLDASYELAANLDWKSILKNCLYKSQVKLGSLTSLYNGGGFFKKIWSKIMSWGIQGVKSVDFDSLNSRNDEFIMDISPSIIGFIPAGGRLRGKIFFDEEKNIIKIKVRNFKFYKLIPGEAVLMFILSVFVADDSMDVNGDTITIFLD